MRRMKPASSRASLWTRHSRFLLGGFLLTVALIIYVWWPLAEAALAYTDWSGPWWRTFDWLLVGIFLFMSLTIVAGADLRRDWLIIFVGTFGGLAIEAWGTQTNLWHYYTAERPPLWIIPAWPIASLSIDRISRLMEFAWRRPESSHSNAAEGRSQAPSGPLRVCYAKTSQSIFGWLYWLAFLPFLGIMLVFIAPTFWKPYTVLAALLCVLLIFTPPDRRKSLLIFAAGAGLGYFLERWGTTRACWTYYTGQTPPLFAVLAHGMASVVFWRTGLLIRRIWGRLGELRADWAGSAGAAGD